MSRFRLKVTMTKVEPGAVDGAQFVDAFDGVDDFLDGLGDLRFHFGRRRARAGAR